MFNLGTRWAFLEEKVFIMFILRDIDNENSFHLDAPIHGLMVEVSTTELFDL